MVPAHRVPENPSVVISFYTIINPKGPQEDSTIWSWLWGQSIVTRIYLLLIDSQISYEMFLMIYPVSAIIATKITMQWRDHTHGRAWCRNAQKLYRPCTLSRKLLQSLCGVILRIPIILLGTFLTQTICIVNKYAPPEFLFWLSNISCGNCPNSSSTLWFGAGIHYRINR